ncbi:MAG: hypothetical protein GY862_00940 [Gammaproteobacteria bacterium]|nr:hypothetical protein [Gammaproteobacteria bacterium]
MNPNSTNNKQRLINLLLKCPSIGNQQGRDALLEELPSEIRDAVKADTRPKMYMKNIVNACMDHPNGLKILIDAVEFFDGKTRQFQAVTDFIGQTGIGAEPDEKKPEPKPEEEETSDTADEPAPQKEEEISESVSSSQAGSGWLFSAGRYFLSFILSLVIGFGVLTILRRNNDAFSAYLEEPNLAAMVGAGFSILLIFAIILNLTRPKKKQPPRLDPGILVDIDDLPCGISEFVGREEELKMLTEALKNPQQSIAAITAGPGAGKSALNEAWLNQLTEYGGARRVLVWSFDRQGAVSEHSGSADFFRKALPFFGYQGSMPGTDTEKGHALAECLRQKPSLLILDGLEPLQHPFTETKTPLDGGIKDAGLHALLLRVLRKKLGGTNSLILISSRQPVKELFGHSCLELELGNLTLTQGRDLLRRLKVRGSNAALENLSRDAGGHALALVLLGKLLLRHFGGRIGYHHLSKALAEENDEARRVRRILHYYDTEYWNKPSWPQRLFALLRGYEAGHERTFMRLLGLFERPMDKREREALMQRAVFASPLRQFTKKALWPAFETRLENAGLLLKWRGDDERRFWDCHPLIRAYFADSFKKRHPNLYRQAQEVLFKYYLRTPVQEEPGPEDLDLLYRAVTHGCLAGEFLKALEDVYQERIVRRQEDGEFEWYSQNKLGLYSQDLTALAAFFPQGWEKPLDIFSLADQGWLLSTASVCLKALGRLAEAVTPQRMAITIYEKQEDQHNACVNAQNLADLLLLLGQISEAKSAACQAITHADNTENLFDRMTARACHARVLHYQGRLDDASRVFAAAEAMQRELQPELPRLYSMQGVWYCALLLDQAADAADWEMILERGQYALEISTQNHLLQDMAFDHLSQACALFALDRLPEARTEFKQAVRGIRAAGVVSKIPGFLFSRGKALRRIDPEQARTDLDEAREIITRCGIKLHAADAALLEGHLELDSGNAEEGKQAWLEAEKLVKETGYHLRDAELELLAARVAYYAGKDGERLKRPSAHLEKARDLIEKTGCRGLLPEWKAAGRELGVRPDA